MTKRKIVLKIGGSLLFDSSLSLQLTKLSKIVEILQEAKNIAAIIIGGGKIARKYIQAARKLNANESLCDTFGIQASRLNALLLITALGSHAYPTVMTSPNDISQAALSQRILVSGGFIPGQSTTSVTFQIAETLEATDVIILTDVDGIYDKDPNKHPDAIKFDSLSISELEQVIYGTGGKTQAAAGEYRIFDAVSLQILKRSRLQVRLTNGNNFSSLRSLLVEENFSSLVGTKIQIE
ncbi:UMP kinase [Candidatus Harpocratesius sp.]